LTERSIPIALRHGFARNALRRKDLALAVTEYVEGMLLCQYACAVFPERESQATFVEAKRMKANDGLPTNNHKCMQIDFEGCDVSLA